MNTVNTTLGAIYIYGIVEIDINCIITKSAIYKKM